MDTPTTKNVQMTETKRVATVDCGTNSIRLLIADIPLGVPDSSGFAELRREMVITRLGQGVDKTGAFDPEALQRTLDAITGYQQDLARLDVDAIRIVATSASRDASNRALFVDGVKAITGIEPEVISGSEEAALSFRGAVSSLSPDLEPPFLVVDIGGGSTEFVLGTSSVEQSVSVDMGSVRVTERFGLEPWTAQKLHAARTWIDQRLDEAQEHVDLSRARTVVGVAGTVTSLAAYVCGVEEYDPDVTHGASPSVGQWREALDFLILQPVATKASLPWMPRGRADVIAGGALIWERILNKLGVLDGHGPAVVVSEHDILDGLALSLAD